MGERRKPSLDCRGMERYLSPFLDGEVDEKRHQLVTEHLAGCRDCAEHLDGLLTVSSTIRGLFIGSSGQRQASRPRRFTGVLNRLTEARWEELRVAVQGVLARRLLRRLGARLGKRRSTRTTVPSERSLVKMARGILADVIGLGQEAEKRAALMVDSFLASGDYEPLRRYGLIDPPPPRLPAEGDRQGREAAVNWARRVLSG